MGVLLSPRRKIWIIIPFVHLWEQHRFALYAEISVDLHCVGFCPLPSIWEKGGLFIIMMGGSSLISGHWCQIFTSSTSFQCIRCMSRFFPVVPRPVPTISRTVVSFATVYNRLANLGPCLLALHMCVEWVVTLQKSQKL